MPSGLRNLRIGNGNTLPRKQANLLARQVCRYTCLRPADFLVNIRKLYDDPCLESLVMKKIAALRALLSDAEGATAIEYGLMAALISVAAISAMGSVGNTLVNTFNYVSNQETNAQAGKL